MQKRPYNLKEPTNRGHPICKVVYMLYVGSGPDSVLSPQLQGLFVVLFCAICNALFWNMLVSLAEYIGLLCPICSAAVQNV